VATDTIYSDVVAIDNGLDSAQIFVGLLTKYCDIFSMHNDKQFINTIRDVIRKHGAMDKLISGSAQLEINKKLKDVFCQLCIDDWQSEAHFQHKNFAELRHKDIKAKVNSVLNVTGASPHTWLLCMEYV